MTQATETESISVNVTAPDGTKYRGRVRARVVDIPNPSGDTPILRGNSSFPERRATDDPGTETDATSKGVEDDPLRAIGDLIPPPYDLRRLAELSEMNSELRKAISTMVTNTVGFGWQIKLRSMDEDQQEKYKKEIQTERDKISTLLATMHPTLPVTELRKRAATDKWLVGNGYLEMLHSPTGKLTGLDHVRGHTVYLLHKDRFHTPIEVPVVLPHENYRIDKVTRRYRFRRFVQILRDGGKIYFKEAGDPRTMSWKTGTYYDNPGDIPYSEHATSLMHDLIYSPDSAYGICLHIAEEESIRGSFAASRVNFNTIDDNNMPSMFVIVEGGELDDQSLDRLKEFTEQQMRKSQNRSKFILLEGGITDEGAPIPGQFRIKVEPLMHLQTADQLFQDYDKNNNEKIRQSFRIPPIFVGNAKEYNRATADAARDLADEQVFQPARDETDHFFNRFVLPAWGIRFFTFRSQSPNVTNAMQILKMAATAEKGGGMTPRRMNQIMEIAFGETMGPLPKGIDPDVPYSYQFAVAQKHGGTPGTDLPNTPLSATTETSPAQRSANPEESIPPLSPVEQGEQIMEGLLALRSRLYDAIERRDNGETFSEPCCDPEIH